MQRVTLSSLGALHSSFLSPAVDPPLANGGGLPTSTRRPGDVPLNRVWPGDGGGDGAGGKGGGGGGLCGGVAGGGAP